MGVVLVDTKRTGSGQQIIKAIDLVTDKPVISIVNTHAHDDHTGSNAEFGATVDIAVHDNSKSHMQAMNMFKGPNVAFLPKRTFQDKLSLSFGKDRIDLYYFGPGHTNGDTIVVFPELGVAHFGDLFPGKTVPVIDSRNGGSGIGLAATLARAVSTISGVEFVITGHDVSSRAADYGGPSMRWAALVEYADFNRDLAAAVTAAIRAGASVDQAAARLVVPDRYRGYDLTRTKPYVQAIYDELKK
jgi:glyoxylase-like metal-dependent hydrolase (beta-lactamase superfamily II)